jgi:iron(III) transport system substrate-binding protein
MIKTMKGTGATLAALLLASTAWGQTELTVYTAIEAEDLPKYAARFNEDHPDIIINWVRDSTGVVTAKLLAEKNNPVADVVWGLAATSLLVLKTEGMLEPYEPVGIERLDAQFRDTDEPPAWVGMNAWAAAICYNTVEAAKHGMTPPTSWKDLTDPQYRGHIVMPNPVSSGTGFLDVSSWLQLFGEEEGWAYMDALHENIKEYQHSGSKPCRHAGAGESVVGISFEFRAARTKRDGAPIDIIVPSEGVGWDMEAAAIVAGTSNLEAAQTLMDWIISDKAMEMYSEGYAIVGVLEKSRPLEHLPEDFASMLIPNDFEWAANNRAAILEEWVSRFDSKSEPR